MNALFKDIPEAQWTRAAAALIGSVQRPWPNDLPVDAAGAFIPVTTWVYVTKEEAQAA